MPRPLRGSKRLWQFGQRERVDGTRRAKPRSTRFPASQYVALAQAAADPARRWSRPDRLGPAKAAATVPSGAGVQRPRSLEATQSAKSLKRAEGLPPGDGVTSRKEDNVCLLRRPSAMFRVEERDRRALKTTVTLRLLQDPPDYGLSGSRCAMARHLHRCAGSARASIQVVPAALWRVAGLSVHPSSALRPGAVPVRQQKRLRRVREIDTESGR